MSIVVALWNDDTLVHIGEISEPLWDDLAVRFKNGPQTITTIEVYRRAKDQVDPLVAMLKKKAVAVVAC